MGQGYNPYAAPKAVDAPTHSERASADFYVVSLPKFWALFIVTLSFYGIYWFYKNWALYRAKTGESIWPVLRGLFSIFFAHRLFRAVDVFARQNDRNLTWQPEATATLYVVATIISRVLDRLAGKSIGSPITDIGALVMVPFLGSTLAVAQRSINVACGDPDGASNARFTPLNILWLAFGALLWGLTIFGFVAGN